MRIFKWIVAHISNRRVWRVYYKSGKRTLLLRKNEAKSLAEVFEGVAIIEYKSFKL